MKLELYLNSLSETYLEEDLDGDSLGSRIFSHTAEMPNWRLADVVLLGLDEPGQNLNDLRKALYNLKQGDANLKICDLGNIKPGLTAEETHQRVSQVLELLVSNHIQVVFIGGNEVLAHSLLESSQKALGHPLFWTHIAPDLKGIPLNNRREAAANQVFGQAAIQLNHIGFQTYLVNQDNISGLEEQGHHFLRLGNAQEQMLEVEIMTRAANLFTIDARAINAFEFPAQPIGVPFGFGAQEACRLAWFAGFAPYIKVFGIHNFYPTNDTNKVSTHVLATLLWYYLEGMAYRNVPRFNDLTWGEQRILTQLEGLPSGLEFMYGIMTDQWWLRIDNDHILPDRLAYMPCSEADFEQARGGEIPDRWLSAQSLIPKLANFPEVADDNQLSEAALRDLLSEINKEGASQDDENEDDATDLDFLLGEDE